MSIFMDKDFGSLRTREGGYYAYGITPYMASVPRSRGLQSHGFPSCGVSVNYSPGVETPGGVPLSFTNPCFS